MTTLTAEQRAGIEKIKNWYEQPNAWPRPPFRLFGPAGTGKTTMAKEIPEALLLDGVRYATFTGKAAHVLRGKGASPVSTIHSGIYYPTVNEEAKARLRAAECDLHDVTFRLERENGPHMVAASERAKELEAEIRVLTAETRRMSWEWNPDSEWAYADLIILDEVSMVGA